MTQKLIALCRRDLLTAAVATQARPQMQVRGDLPHQPLLAPAGRI